METMPMRCDRRRFLASTAALSAAAALPAAAAEPPAFKLGTVSYMLGAKMDLETLLRACRTSGFEAVELRTTHAHKVETTLSADERKDVRRRIEDSGVRLWGFGSVCEFHSPDAAVVRKHVDDCRAWCKLAADLGAKGVKVRPNAFPKGVAEEKTLEQIGTALRECGKAAADHGVEIWVEVHGHGIALPSNMRKMMDHCGHPSVGICWNSNPSDLVDGSLQAGFDLLKKDIKSCHINELWNPKYPWRELFRNLRAIGYDRFTLAEIAGIPEDPAPKDPFGSTVRFMRYYRALWEELTRV